ncbi:MAG: hypothetical protein V7606_4123 [Burkholderiales bacterium]
MAFEIKQRVYPFAEKNCGPIAKAIEPQLPLASFDPALPL